MHVVGMGLTSNVFSIPNLDWNLYSVCSNGISLAVSEFSTAKRLEKRNETIFIALHLQGLAKGNSDRCKSVVRKTV